MTDLEAVKHIMARPWRDIAPEARREIAEWVHEPARGAILIGFISGLTVALGCLGIGAAHPPPPGTLAHGRPWVGWAVAGVGFLTFAWCRLRLRRRP